MSKKKTDNIELMEINRKKTQRAATALEEAFTWAETKEGEAYWAAIAYRLWNISNLSEKK